MADVDTVGGFILHEAGMIPEAGQSIRWHNIVFRVLHVQNKRIQRVEIRLPGAPLSGIYKAHPPSRPEGN